MGKRKSSKIFNLFSSLGRRRQRRGTDDIEAVDISTLSSAITDSQPSTSTAPTGFASSSYSSASLSTLTALAYYVDSSDSSGSVYFTEEAKWLHEEYKQKPGKKSPREMPMGKGKCPPGKGKKSKKVSSQESSREKEKETYKVEDKDAPNVKGKCPPGTGKKSKKASVQESPREIQKETSQVQDKEVPSGKGKCPPETGKKSKKVSIQEPPQSADKGTQSATGKPPESSKDKDIFLAGAPRPTTSSPPQKPPRLSFFERLKRFRKNKVAPQPRMEQKSSVTVSIVSDVAGFRGEFLISTIQLSGSESESSRESSADFSMLRPAPDVVHDYYPSTLVSFFANER